MSTCILTSMFPKGLNGQAEEVFRQKIKKRGKFAFVASEFEKLHEKTDKYFRLFLDMFEMAGICFDESYVVDGRMSVAEAQKAVKEADVIWLSGGDTPTQFYYLQKYGLVTVLKQHDGVIIGMSAGSINMAETAICTLSCGHFKQEIYDGLGCVDISVEPHFVRSKVSDELLELSKKYTIYGLCDNGFIVCSADCMECYGEIYKISHGTVENILATYPVMLKEYDPEWAVIFEEEKEKILHTAGESIEEVFHFGSTSIPGMISKPTVDMLVILKKDIDLDAFCKCMTDAGYLCTKYPDKTKKRKNCMNFVVPYTVDGVDQYKCYIHIRENDVPRPELLFATYLREHPEVAKEYGELKQKLALCYGDNRQEYMMAKTEFVEKYTCLATEEKKNPGGNRHG